MWLWDHTRNSNYKLLTLIHFTNTIGWVHLSINLVQLFFPHTTIWRFHCPWRKRSISSKKIDSRCAKDSWSPLFFKLKWQSVLWELHHFFFRWANRANWKAKEIHFPFWLWKLPHWPKLSSFISVMWFLLISTSSINIWKRDNATYRIWIDTHISLLREKKEARYRTTLWIQRAYRTPKYNIRVRYTAKLGI